MWSIRESRLAPKRGPSGGMFLKTILNRLEGVVARYLDQIAFPGEYLPLLRWQIAEGHALTDRTTMPGHITTSAIVLSSDHKQVLLIEHISIGRWLQPGGHYEPSQYFNQSAAREALEETGVADLVLHPWHSGGDIPIAIDSQDVRGRPSHGEKEHVHHDLQYLFVADPTKPLIAQREEVHSAHWKPVIGLSDIAPKVARRLRSISPP